MDERTTNVRARVGAAARIFVLSACAAIAIVAFDATPAAAHSASGPRPSNYRTTVQPISPPIRGVSVRVVDLGNKLELTNRTTDDVVVLGYLSEPYLRVGPRGVYENLRSPATYLNRTRTGDTPLPDIARGTGASTPPRWHRVSGSRTARWHDHRAHWMGSSPPAAVRADPGRLHTINPEWSVVLRSGARDVEVHGRLEWVPGPSGWVWLPGAAALFVIGVAVTRAHSRRALIAAIVALVALDAAHAVSAELARAGTQFSKTMQFLGDDWVSVIVWVFAGFTIWALWRRRPDALFGVVLVGAMVAFVSGITDLSYLWKSQLPTIGPDVVARAEVAAAAGLGLGLAVGALVRIVRSAPARPARASRDSRWLERLVAGLDDDAVALESTRLDAGEVVPLALADLAERLTPIASDLGPDAVVFVVLAEDEVGSHVWGIVAAPLGSSGVRVQRGRPAPARIELRLTFPAFLSLLGGTLTADAAITAGRLVVDGDASFLAEVEPCLSATAGRRLPAGHGQ